MNTKTGDQNILTFVFALVLSVFSTFVLNAQNVISRDKFNDKALLYTAAYTAGTTVTTSNDAQDFITAPSSVAMNYSIAKKVGNVANSYFASMMNYVKYPKDWSFNVDKIILKHKGGSNKLAIKIKLYEDNDISGGNTAGDEQWMSTSVTAGQLGWTTSEFNLVDFTRVGSTGAVNSSIDLNRLRAWEIYVEDVSGKGDTSVIKFDELLIHTNYTSPTSGDAYVTGAFTQLWNDVGCKCGLWNQARWEQEFQKMKDMKMTSFVIQYGVYDIYSWYSPTTVPGITQGNTFNTINTMVKAAENVGIGLYIGLYYTPSKWDNASKTNAATYSNLLVTQKHVIDDIHNLFGSSTAFKGWYIPEEIDDYSWQSGNAKTYLFQWVQDVAAYAHTKNAQKPVMISPFFNLWMPADWLKQWYEDFFIAAPDLDLVIPQDGVGITLKNVNYDVPLYLSKIKEACDAHQVQFGVNIESFQQTSGWPIDNGNFAATSATIDRYKAQLWEAGLHNPVEILTFEWAYMEPGNGAAADDLYNNYLLYVTSITTNVAETIDNVIQVYPNPANQHLYFNQKISSVKLFSVEGKLLLTQNNIQSLDVALLPAAVYTLQVQQANGALQILKVVKD